MKQRISIKRIIIDLLSIKEQVVEHFKDNTKYQTLINYLITNKRLNDEEKREISLNEYFNLSDWELKGKLMPRYYQ